MNKGAVIDALQMQLNAQLKDLQLSINAVNESIKGEEKSSAGDKYETARAMNHNELDRLNSSYQKILKSGSILNRLSRSENNQRVQLGSLVKTSNRVMFFCTGIGRIHVDGIDVLTMSMGSPIGQVFLGKQKGDEIEFNNSKEIIEEIR